MFKRLIEWFRTLWRDDAPDAIEQMYLDDYAPYVRAKYGIAEPFVEEEKESQWRK